MINQKHTAMYQTTIKSILTALKRTDIDPRHIEGYMRLQYSTLDHLSSQVFVDETKIGIECVDVGGAESAEANAQSYGL